MLGVSNLEFSVEADHTQDLTFNFDSLLSVELLGGLQLVIQKWDEETGQWTTIDGSEPGGTLLSLGLLGGGGTGAVVEGLEAGQYRAFVTNEGGLAASLTVGSTLAATGTDYDFTQIGGFEAVEASGNVLDNDTVPDGTIVQSVNGTAVTGEDTVIEGTYGTLTISPDGTYTYTPNAEGEGIGQVDAFEYTLFDPATGSIAAATLFVQIGSDGTPDLVWDPDNPGAPATFDFGATADTGDAAVVWENVSDTEFFAETGSALLTGGLGQTSTYISEDTFVITDNMDVTGSIAVNVLLAALSNGAVYLERETTPGSWEIVASDSFNIVLGGLGTVASINLDDLTLLEGTYRVRATLSGTLVNVSASIVTDVDVTYLDQYQVDDLTPSSGNLLDNDALGSTFTSLQIFDTDAGDFVAVGSGPLTIEGEFGTLTVDAAGNYIYTPTSIGGHFDEPQVDLFTYRLVHPNGTVAESSLSVTIDPSGAGVPTIEVMAGDTVELDGLGDLAEGDNSPDDRSDDAPLSLRLVDGSGQEGDIPLDGLSVFRLEDGDADSDTGQGGASLETAFEQPTDPFGHLVLESEWNQEDTSTV